MPVSRKSSGRSSTGAGGKQSTLSFSHRVTKPISRPGKDSAAKPSPLSNSVKPEEPAAPDDVVVDIKPEAAQEAVVPQPAPVVREKSKAEVAAEKLTDAQINKYWCGIEAQRGAKRVHQEELSTDERVLRYFDVSSQYGPYAGATRLKRWMRAERLGLHPPIEVLAVLLKEETKGSERAYMDELMNPAVAVDAV